jgi:TonB family protein
MKVVGVFSLILFFTLNNSHYTSVAMAKPLADTIFCVAHDTAVCLVVEKNAEFQDGDILKFRSYVMKNIIMPHQAMVNAYKGRSTIKFIVDWDGQVKNVSVYKSSGYKILDNEAVRVIKKSPRWTSAKNANICVPQQMYLPIEFINLGVIGE